MTATISSALWPHVPCCSHRRDSNSLPRLQVSLLTPTCAPHMVYLSKRYRCDTVYVKLSQSRPHSPLLVPSMWEHILRAQLPPAREVPVPPWREPTILSIQILVQGLFLFLNREPSFFFWSTLVNPNLMGTMVLIQLTVISCIINASCCSCVSLWCLVHSGGSGFAGLHPVVYRAWVTLVCLLLDTPFGRRSVGALPS